MVNPPELPHLIDLHPNDGGVVAVIVRGPDKDIASSDTLLLVDLGYGPNDHEVATKQLEKLLTLGFSPVAGVDQAYPYVSGWSYRATLGDRPTSSRITIMADYERSLVFHGLFITDPAWFAVEAKAQSAAIAIGNFQFLRLGPFDSPGFHTRLITMMEATMILGQVVGASIERNANRPA